MFKAIFLFILAASVTAPAAPPECARALTLLDLQKVGSQKGLAIVTDDPAPKSPAAQKRERRLYGTRVVHPKSTHDKKIDGLALHLASEPESLAATGNIDLMRNDRSMDALVDNNWAEYVFAEKVWPGAMPESVNATELLSGAATRRFENLKKASIESIDHYLASKNPDMSPTETRSLVELARYFFELSDGKFPVGAFIKNIGENQTADNHDLIMTFKSRPRDVARAFVTILEASKKALRRPGLTFENPAVQAELLSYISSATPFFVSLLTDPAKVMVQKKMDPVMIDGTPLEVRVDFARGIAVNGTARFTYAYVPDELQRAKALIDAFFNRLPPSRRNFSGGADVLFLKDGSAKIIEFNFGNQGGFIFPPMESLAAYQFISTLTRKPTSMLDFLGLLYQLSPENQKKYLASLKTEYDDYKNSLEDLSQVEVAQWLRDRAMDEWRANPTTANAKILLNYLREILKSKNPGVQKEMNLLYKGAARYVAHRLGPSLGARMPIRGH